MFKYEIKKTDSANGQGLQGKEETLYIFYTYNIQICIYMSRPKVPWRVLGHIAVRQE